MRIEKLSNKESGHWKRLLKDYLDGAPILDSLYGRRPELNAFEGQISDKAKSFGNRTVLVDALGKQYSDLGIQGNSELLINSLKEENTFTVTTGHQLCLMGGPAYFIYKIAGCISLARALKEKYPNKKFIPVFWLATEDHDFAEINHFHLFNRRFEWNIDSKGPVGRLKLEDFESLSEELKEVLGNADFAEELYDTFQKSYLQSNNLSEATIKLVYELFGFDELLCLDADEFSLKSLFVPIMEQELLEETSFKSVQKANEILTKADYTTQIHLREINLFYIQDNYRERIISDGNEWSTKDGNHKWSKEQVIEELHAHPECFSPNVAMRPLYQECILPNLAYIGGGGEMAYWLQLKPIFDAFKVDFPMLIPRLSATSVLPSVAKKIDKLGLPIQDYFNREEDLIKKYMVELTPLQGFDEEEKMIELIEKSLMDKMQELDEGFRKSIAADVNAMQKLLERIQGKYGKQIKQKEETSINQLRSVQNAIYPHSKLQERHENFSSWYLRSGKDALNSLIDSMDPFEFNMLVMYL